MTREPDTIPHISTRNYRSSFSLAAVDMHTAQHLLNNCFASPLAHGRTIILVTHHVRLCLPAASYLVELSKGKVLRQGSIRELRDQGLLEAVIEHEDPPESVKNEAHNDGGPMNSDAKLSSRTGTGNGKLIEVEGRAEGRVPLSAYLTYVRAAGILPWVFTIALMLFFLSINILNQVGIPLYSMPG